MNPENPNRVPKPKYEEGPMSDAEKSEIKADFAPVLVDVLAQIAELEARGDSLSADDRDTLKQLRDMASGITGLLSDCEDPDFHGRIKDAPKNADGDSVYPDPENN